MRRILQIMIIIIIIGVVVLQGKPEDVKTLEIGAKAPDFSLKGVDGKMHSLADYSDAQVLVIIFTANHCPTAQAYEGRIKKVAADYKNKNVQVVAISSNDPEALRLDEMSYSDLGDTYEDMKLAAEQRNFNFPYLYDGNDQKVARSYGPMATPHVFIFDQERKLRYVGRVDDNEHIEKVTQKDMRNAIQALLNGEEVPVKQTKVFGCSIKWSYKQKAAQKMEEAWKDETVNLHKANLDSIKKLVENNSDDLRLINFWATWCGPCRVEFPDLIKINYIYRNRDFEFITVSMDSPDSQAKVLEFLQEHNASNSNYLFQGDKYKLMDAVDSKWPGSIPYTILIKPGGEIIYRHVGLLSNSLELRQAIVDYLGRTYQ